MTLKSLFKRLFCGVCIITTLCACSRSNWKLVWQDDFNGSGIDYTVWSHTDRGNADWANTQSKDPRCYEMRGCLFGFELLKFGAKRSAKFISPIFHYFSNFNFAIILRIYKIFG